MSNCSASCTSVRSPLIAAIATFALKADVWFRRGLLLMLSPDSRAKSCPLSGRSSTYRPVQILEAGSSNAASTFVAASTDTNEIRKELALDYFKNHIIESYLVAAKVADKLRYLTPAQGILSVSIRILLLWLLVGALTFVLVPGQTK